MASRTQSLPSTELAFGRYEHRAELGHGGSGRVVEVVDHADGGALKALKIVAPEHAERLAWELDVLAGAAHPSLARVHELLRVEAPLGPPFRLPRGAFVLVEDRAPGAVSSGVLAALETPARVALARTLVAQIAGALDALHARGLVHGDVKPANVVVRTEGEPRATLVDLGLAVAFGRGGTGGTPRFLAPEALLGERSPATDLYALGGTLHEWLVGGVGDASRSDAAARGLHAWSELPIVIDPDLAALVRACLDPDPGARPRSAADVARRLGASDVLTLLGAPSPVERARRASVVPMVGRGRERDRLVRAIADAFGGERPRPTLVAIRGPSGSGRTRLVLDAVSGAQRELALAQRAAWAPSFRRIAAGDGVPRAPTVLFAPSGEAEAIAIHHAAALSGAPVVVIVEREAEVPGADVDVVLGPLGALPFAELVHALVEAADGALVESFRRATRGLPGVFVRALAERWTAGADPRAGLGDPGAQVRGTDLGIGSDLALAAALAGGAIDARTARRVVGRDARRAAETLVAKGVAEHDADGRLSLHESVIDGIAERAEDDTRRRIASALVNALGPGSARAAARAALGAPEAIADVLAEATRLRDAGRPEAAARFLRRARRTLQAEPLALAHADALLASGRVEAAIEVVAESPTPGTRWLHAEALRRAGLWVDARAQLSGIPPGAPDAAAAAASLARIALVLGDAPPTLEGLAPRAEDAAFVDEARALVAQSQGEPERALAIAEAARAALDGRSGLPAFARARAAARLWAIEASAKSAMGDAEGAHEAFERSATLAARAGEAHATAAFLVNVGIGRLELGLLGPALEALTRGAERLVLIGRDRDAARALYNVANAALLAGDRAHARHAAEGALRETVRVGDDEAHTLAEVVLADVDVGEGRPRAAERRLSALAERSDSVLVAARLAIVRALVRDLEGARAALARAAPVDDPSTPLGIERDLAVARIALAAGDPRAARATSAAILARLGTRGGLELRLRAHGLAADAAEAAGDPSLAEAALREQRSLLDRALSSLPPERQAAFRALHARALAVQPARAVDRAGPGVTRHARELLGELRASAIGDRLVASAHAIASAEHAFLVVRETDGALRVQAAHGSAGRLDPETARLSTSIVARCLDRRIRVESIDAGTDVGLDAGASIHALAVRSVVALPLALGDRPAVLYVDDRLRPSAFGPGLVDALEELAGFAAVAFANAARARRERRAQVLATRRERTLRVSLDEKTREAALLAAERPAHVDLVAESAAMRSVVSLAARVAASDASLLLVGESGTGKEVVARFVHRTSARAALPFVAESCAAIPEGLFESALFGHVRGAFSGALARRRGLFELAEGGTLFLDEVGEMPLAMQAKLLRALSAREIWPMGSDRTRAIDVRVIAATHHDLRAMVARGTFREDLFYRLAVVEVPLPPLRDRPEDVEPLARAFVRHQAGEKALIEPAALAALAAHPWPGNVRELENEIRRALALDPDALRAENLSVRVRGEVEAAPDDLDLKRATERLERRLVERALTRAGHNVTQAAKLLGLSRFGLQKMMARQGGGRPGGRRARQAK